MTATVFRNQERQYQLWLKSNRQGYVLTTTRNASPYYMSLHRANCRMISRHTKSMTNDAFTGRAYIKICSRSSNDLREWIKANGGKDFTKRCTICGADTASESVESLETYYLRLDAAVAHSRSDTKARQARLKLARKKPAVLTAATTIFDRNPDVIAEVLDRAEGYCGKCKKAAPFRRASDDSPYLEIHHRIPLAQGGDDTVENAVALCPNCHREAHFGTVSHDS